jgi:hypothetical protein
MKKRTLSLALVLLFAGCSLSNMTPNQVAIATTATNIARIAASAAATFYGGPAAGALASDGLDALGSVLQSFVGAQIPTDVVKASPGIKGVGPALVDIVSPDHKVSQSDVDKVNRAAAIAETLKAVVVVPKTASTESP